MTAVACIAGLVGIAASVEDLARRRISNWIPACACVSGLAVQSMANGWHGAVSAVLGIAAGAGIFLIFYLAGGMGGGDVKLMAGFGALLGVRRLLEASLWTAGCGGLLAVTVIAARSFRRLASRRRSAESIAAGKPVLADQNLAESIPYAPAIAAGVWLTLVAKA